MNVAGLNAWCDWVAQLLGSRASVGVFANGRSGIVELAYVPCEDGPKTLPDTFIRLASVERKARSHLSIDRKSCILVVPVRDTAGTPLVVGCALPSTEKVVRSAALRLIKLSALWIPVGGQTLTGANTSALSGRLDQAKSRDAAAQSLVDALVAEVPGGASSVRLSYFSKTGRGSLDLRAVSNQACPSETGQWLSSVKRAVREFTAQRARTVGLLECGHHDHSDGLVRTQHTRHLSEFGCKRLMTLGLTRRAGDDSIVLFAEFMRDIDVADSVYNTWSTQLGGAAATLAWHERREKSLLALALQHCKPSSVLTRLSRRWLRWGIATAAVAALVIASVVSVPATVRAPAEVVGVSPRVISAPRDGYIERVSVRPGDQVKQGQVLAVLNTDDLRSELVKWQAELRGVNALYHTALAKGDRNELSLQRARTREINAEIGFIEQQLERSTLRAERDGLIARGDLEERLGGAVVTGEALFETVLGHTRQIQVYVRDSDVTRVVPGVSGQLVLAAMPQLEHAVVATHVKPIATVYEQETVFVVEANATSLDQAVLPGMTGFVRLETGETSLLSAWTADLRRSLWLTAWRLGVV